MSDQDRVSRFEADVAELRLKTSGGSVERAAGVVGLLMMVVGIGVAIGAALKAGTKQDARDLDELIILSIAMLGLVIAGAALFIWRVLAQFWRFWMLRQTFEHQRHIEQLLEATRPATANPSEGVPSEGTPSEGRLMELVTDNEGAVGLGGSTSGSGAPERHGA